MKDIGHRNFFIILVALIVCSVNCSEEENKIIEARGKTKYALLTNLAILFAVKVGLYKIFLGIALVIVSIKTLVVMAWALAISKYVPDAWPHYKNTDFVHSYYGDFNNFAQKPELPYNEIHFFYVAAAKFFILKIVYGIIFFALLSKGWHFVLWFIHHLKQKKEHVEYIQPEPIHHGYHGYEHHEIEQHGYEEPYHGYDQPYHGYDQPYHGYGKPTYGEYETEDNKRIYDADGSYSIKSYKRT
ncbi:unnamed protein product [Diatraea saccharalis]|uniref:Uncharacterized protein n=1 Tax=Diatraea saccharalis TaxID=40085 RepID=A0A9N9RGE6_9NEOP|nr:unnamed protein product [Diatraea saccharalis]